MNPVPPTVSATGSTGRRRRPVAGLGCLLVVVLAALVAVYIALPVLGSAPSRALPASCAGDSDAATTLPSVAIPGTAARGSLIARGGDIEVAVVRDTVGGHFSGIVYVVVSGSRVTRQVPLGSDMTVAAVVAGYVYLYNDKIGYVIVGDTGRSAPTWVEFDNYRGVYVDGGIERVQTQATITLVGPGVGVERRTMPMAGIVDGCVVAERHWRRATWPICCHGRRTPVLR